MPNREQRRRTLRLEALRDQATEAQSHLSGIQLELDDGSVLLVPHPLLMDDEQQRRVEAFQAGEGLDRDDDGKIKEPHRVKGKLCAPASERMAKAVLGEKEHARFVAAGGHSNDVTLAWQLMTAAKADAHPGVDPKDTGSASSS